MTIAECRLRILGLSLNDWSDQWTNRQHLLSRLGRTNTVLYSRGGWFNWDIRSDEWRQTPFAGEVTHSDNVWLDKCPHYLVRLPRFPSLETRTLALIARRWNNWLTRRGTGSRVLLLFHPQLFPYVRFVQRDILAYHAYDLFQHTPGWNERNEKLEISLLQTADIVTASSDAIADALQKKIPREIRVLPNGVDLLDFEQSSNDSRIVPADLDTIPRPRLGYVGSLAFTVDFELVAALADLRPHWNFVFIGASIGKFNADTEAAFSKCRALPNVHFLGQKHVREVAHYSMNMDVNLMLYRISSGIWTQAGYPLKLHEYLAAGKPIVSADLPSVRPFSGVVRIASGVSDWISAIQEAIATGGHSTEKERRAIAAQNTWDARVATMQTWLREHLEQNEIKK